MRLGLRILLEKMGNYKARNLSVCWFVTGISQELFIRSASHLAGLLPRTKEGAVSNMMQFGRTTCFILTIFEKTANTALYSSRGVASLLCLHDSADKSMAHT